MNTAIERTNGSSAALVNSELSTAVESALIEGDLSKLSTNDRIQYYNSVCNSVGLNPLTKPFAYIKLNGKLTLYAQKAATDELRRIYGISIDKPDIQHVEELVIVTVTARDKTDRTDTDLGVVNIGALKGENKANALMKAITKAKRRVTLSICGLGMLDETEVESIPNAVKPLQSQTQDITLENLLGRIDGIQTPEKAEEAKAYVNSIASQGVISADDAEAFKQALDTHMASISSPQSPTQEDLIEASVNVIAY